MYVATVLTVPPPALHIHGSSTSYRLQVGGSCFSRASDSPRHTHEDHRERATVHIRTSFLLKPLVIYSMNYAADVEANTQNSPYSFNGIFHSISGLQLLHLRRTYQTNPAMVMAQ